MLFKVAWNNIKKSLKDFSIYFFTLVIAVSIFYTFNSVGSQESMLIMSDSKKEMARILVSALNYVSVFVSVVLGFLIVYANNFLIKRRKKEIGLYLTLGMSKRRVSSIILLETLLIGLISLIIGLATGVVFSQGMSLFTAKMFEADMSQYKFIFSGISFLKTIMYFSIIFVLVMIFNVVTLSRYKLIDLLNAKKKNEQIKKRNPVFIIIAFILTIVLYYYAYKLLFNGALNEANSNILKMLAAGAGGTLLFFYSISSVLMMIIKRIPRFYYHKLNCFTVSQINAKVNTTIISTTIISLMLLLTIGILSGSISLVNVFNESLKTNNKTDITIERYSDNYIMDENGYPVYQDLEKLFFDDVINSELFNNNIADYAKYHLYYSDSVNAKDLVSDKKLEELKKDYGDSLILDFPIKIMILSDYNNILNLYGEDSITLDDNEYLLTANINTIIDAYGDHYAHNGSIKIGDNVLYPDNNTIKEIAFFNANANEGTIIVSDIYQKLLTIDSYKLIANYKKDRAYEDIEYDMDHNLSDFNNLSYSTKTSIEATSVGLKAIMIFLGLYLGIIFAISSATILAIGQLSEASDNAERYLVLKKLGADKADINRALFMQIGVIFIFPLIVAIIHAFFGLREINKIIKMLGNVNLMGNILLTALFIILVYGGYFIVTYLISKNIIKEN